MSQHYLFKGNCCLDQRCSAGDIASDGSLSFLEDKVTTSNDPVAIVSLFIRSDCLFLYLPGLRTVSICLILFCWAEGGPGSADSVVIFFPDDIFVYSEGGGGCDGDGGGDVGVVLVVVAVMVEVVVMVAGGKNVFLQ